MAHAAIAFAKASRRRRMMACTTSIGPGATNMVTAAAVAHVNRLPVLLLPGRRVRQPPARSGAAADRGFLRRHDLGQRLLPPGVALFRPHRTARADHPGASARHEGADRSGRMRPGDVGALPGHAGRSLRLPGELLCREDLDAAPHSSRRARTGAGCGVAEERQEAVHRRGRRRAVFRGREGAGGFRRAARHSGRRDAGRQVEPAPRPSGQSRRASASPARRRRMRWPRRPTWCWRSARGCRISPPARGRCSRTRTAASSASTSRLSTRPSTTRCRWSPMREPGSRNSSGARRAGRRRMPGPPRRASEKARWVAESARYTDPTNAELAVRRAGHRRGAAQRVSHRDVVVCAAGGLPGELHKHWKASHGARLPHGIRLFLHGLRDRRRPRRQDGRPDARSHRDGRRRLLSDDEFRDRHLGDARPQADRRAARQPRLRLHQPAAAGDRRRASTTCSSTPAT